MNNCQNTSGIRKFVIVFLVAAITSAAVTLLIRPIKQSETSLSRTSAGPQATYADAKDRVLKSGIIRAGYAVYPPASFKDPNTGKLNGICVDLLEKAAENLGLKVEWTEEVPFGDMIAGLNSERYDIIGSAVWANAARGKAAEFTIPLYYNGVGIYARGDNNAFPNGLSSIQAIDQSNLKIAVIDGEMSDLIANTDFPKAKRVGLPQLSEGTQLLLEVATGKADITFVQSFTATEYLRANPGSVKNITPDRPIRIFPVVYMVKASEYPFRNMLNASLQELVDSGYVDQLIGKYAPNDPGMYPVAFPYRTHER